MLSSTVLLIIGFIEFVYFEKAVACGIYNSEHFSFVKDSVFSKYSFGRNCAIGS